MTSRVQTTIPERSPLNREGLKFILLLGLYCLVSLVIRVALSGGLELDESEQLVLAQTLRSGYGPQPPLYVWLQYSVFSLFGISIFSLALLKTTLQFTTYLLVYVIADKIIEDTRGKQIAVLSLFLSPQYGWEFHRTLTNTVLATAAGAALLILVFHLRKKPAVSGYALLGVIAALGTLSKYNFALLIAALLLAGLSMKQWRPVILDRRIFAGILTGIILTASHSFWAFNNIGKVGVISKKLEISGSHLLFTYTQGIFSLIIATVGLFWPLLIVYLLLFSPVRKVSLVQLPGSENRNLLGRTILVILLICLAIVFATRLTRFNDRWLAPLLFFLPVYLVSRFSHLITTAKYKIFMSISVAVILFMTVLFPARVFLASKTGRALRYNFPYRDLTAELRGSGFNGGNIFAEDHRVGGNLRLQFPGSPVHVPERPDVAPSPEGPHLIVWDARNSDTVPAGLLEYAIHRIGSDVKDLEPGYVEAPMLYFKEKNMRLGYYLIE
jgi:4-amino-4-deoxy-L-arabinose transferase-like glycosyltransferase